MNERTCEWREDDMDSGIYSTGCGHAWEFTNGTLDDNHALYCPFCGGKIIDVDRIARDQWRAELKAACRKVGLDDGLVVELVDALMCEERDDRSAEQWVQDELDSWPPGDAE